MHLIVYITKYYVYHYVIYYYILFNYLSMILSCLLLLKDIKKTFLKEIFL